MKKCEKCQTEVADGLKFCTNCGNKIEDVAPTEAPAPAEPKPVETPIAEPVTAPAAIISETPVSNPIPSPVETPAPAKKPMNLDIKTIVLIAVAVLGIGFGVFGMVMGMNKKEAKPEVVEQPAEKPEEPTTPVVTTSTPSGTTVTLANFQLTIPKTMSYEQRSDQIIIADATDTWAAAITYNGKIKFDAITTANLQNVQTTSIAEGYANVAVGTSSIAGVKYHYVDLTKNGNASTLSFWSTGGDGFFLVESAVVTNTYDHSVLSNVATVVKTAKSASQVSNRAFGETIGKGLVKTIDEDGLTDELDK